MSCREAINAAVLADYWLAALAEPEEEAVELHLLSCDDCGARFREVIALAEGIRKLAASGALRLVVNWAYVDAASANGLQVRQYGQAPGGSVNCTVTADDDLLIARLAADLTGAGRVDLCILDGNGVEQQRLPDIPVCAGAGEVLYQESMTFAKAAPDNRMIARLVALDDSGAERLLGEYTFNHTRSLPGPGAW